MDLIFSLLAFLFLFSPALSPPKWLLENKNFREKVKQQLVILDLYEYQKEGEEIYQMFSYHYFGILQTEIQFYKNHPHSGHKEKFILNGETMELYLTQIKEFRSRMFILSTLDPNNSYLYWEWIQDANRREEIYQQVRKLNWYSGHTFKGSIRSVLLELRELLGEQAFQQGFLPSHLPEGAP